MRNQTRSTKPLLFDLRTEELSQIGHSLILLAKVSCIKSTVHINRLLFGCEQL
jgi:hypothetical protein